MGGFPLSQVDEQVPRSPFTSHITHKVLNGGLSPSFATNFFQPYADPVFSIDSILDG
jgi:hypothetical protein